MGRRLTERISDRLVRDSLRLSLRARSILAITLPLIFLVPFGASWLTTERAQQDLRRSALGRVRGSGEAGHKLADSLRGARENAAAFASTGRIEHLHAYHACEQSAIQSLAALQSFSGPDERKDVRRIHDGVRNVLESLSTYVQSGREKEAASAADQARALLANGALELVTAEIAALERRQQRTFEEALQGGGYGPATLVFVLLLAGAAAAAAAGVFLKALGREQQQTIENAAHARASAILARYEVFKAELMGAAEPACQAAPATARQNSPLAQAGQHEASQELGALRIEAGILRSVLEGMRDAIIVVDRAGTCLFSNAAAETMWGRDVTLTPLRDWPARYGLLREDMETSFAAEDLPLKRALRGSTAEEILIYRRAADGGNRIWVASSAMPLRDRTGSLCGAAAVFRDITERRSTEEALSRAKEEAERANRAKSEFLSRMSHELRTPLNAILGFAQLLQMARLGEHDHDSVEQILKGGRHLLTLINEVLDISRIESGRLSLALERIALSDTIQEAASLIEPQAAKQKVQLYIEAGAAWRLHITTDRQRFKQVILNLMSNAVKYNREGGSVRVSAEGRDSYLRLSISDTGPGIPPEKMHLLFSPFERLGAEHHGVEGTGIGLALSKRLVEAMSGRIGVESEPGQGSTFWIELPIANTSAFQNGNGCRDDLAGLNAGVSGGASAAILCIEDNESNFRLIARALAQWPEIKLVSGVLGASAVPLAEEHHPDLILLDMHLPDVGGDEVLRRLKENPRTAGIPVIVVSADATPPQMQRMLEAGVVAYLTKPLDIQKLLTVVNQSIKKGAPSPAPCLEA